MPSPAALSFAACCASVPSAERRSDLTSAGGVRTDVAAIASCEGTRVQADRSAFGDARRERARHRHRFRVQARAPLQLRALRVDGEAGTARVAADRAARAQAAGHGFRQRELRIAGKRRAPELRCAECRPCSRGDRPACRRRPTTRSSRCRPAGRPRRPSPWTGSRGRARCRAAGCRRSGCRARARPRRSRRTTARACRWR